MLLLAVAPLAPGQVSSLKITRVDIKHIGPQAVNDEYIRANIRLKPGDPYIGVNVDDDVRTLYATGLFYNIRVAADITADGVILTYIVQAKPRLMDIKYQGNDKVKTSSLQKKVASKVGQPLDERKLFTDAQELEKLYQKMGYPQTKVKYSLNIDENAGHGTVTFEIKESPKVKILRVEFAGATVFRQKELRKLIKTKRYRWYLAITGKGVFKDEQFDEDKAAVTKFYHDHGYIDFEIKDVKFEYPDPKHMVVRIFVYEGSQYKVGTISFTGATIFSTNHAAITKRTWWPFGRFVTVPTAKLSSQYLPLKSAQVFTPSGVSSNVTVIEKFYESRGYIDVSEGSTLRVIKTANTESNTIDLEYQVDEGRKSYVEKIEIRGNTKTKDKVLRRELAISPGEVFDMVHVDLSKRRLEGLDYFEKVDSRVEPADPGMPDRKNLVIGVEEKNTGNLSVGAGFSSVDALVGFVEVSEGNFDLFNPPRFKGGGQKLRLRVQLGTQRQDYTASFVEPWFLGRKLTLGVDAYHTELSYTSPGGLYTEEHTGARVSLSRALGSELLIGGVSYTIENVGIIFGSTKGVAPANGIPPTLLKDNGYALLSKVGASLIYDTRNSNRLPDKGQKTELSTELAGGPFGGAVNFYKLELKTAWYFKGFFPDHVLEIVGRTGVADGYGGKDMPFYERFFLGGLDSMRGYKYRDVAPRDPGFKEPVGGKTYWFGSVEYSIPIIAKLRFAAFYDIGEVQREIFRYNFSDYNDNLGIGLRLNLPIGPLRIDYGVPITHDKYNSGAGQFQFGVGYSRDF